MKEYKEFKYKLEHHWNAINEAAEFNAVRATAIFLIVIGILSVCYYQIFSATLRQIVGVMNYRMRRQLYT